MQTVGALLSAEWLCQVQNYYIFCRYANGNINKT